MKKIVAVLMTVIIAMFIVSCKNENSENAKKENKSETKVVIDNNEENKGEAKEDNNEGVKKENEEENKKETSGNSSFDFVHKPVLNEVEPVKVKEIDFDELFDADDVDFDLSLNVEKADAAKLAGMSDEELRLLSEKKVSFLNAVVDALSQKNIDVDMDTASGEIIMDAEILFNVDEAEVSGEGKAFLNDFIPAYLSVVSKDEYKGFISELTIEGHTDTDGTYDYNKELSQKRADNVKEYILSDAIGLQANDHNLVEKLAASYGRSYDEPVKNSSGEIDMAASRRVTFGFMISID